MIELLYFATQIQCGVGGEFLDIQVNVYQNQELVETMMVEDRVLLPVDSVNDLTLEYAASVTPPSFHFNRCICGIKLYKYRRTK